MTTTTYYFTSGQFTGDVILQYNDDGALVSLDLTSAELNTAQINWFNHSMPKFLKQFQDAIKGQPTVKLTKAAKTEVTFDMFWQRYNEKTRSSKKKTEQRWNRMSQRDRDKAYAFIPAYEQNIPAGVAKKYAETYLNAELWNN